MNSLNARIPTKKVWEKFKKVNGNYKPRKILPLEGRENTNTLLIEVAEIFADYYANISRDPDKKNEPEKNRKRKKQEY